jgi:plasmid stabilization system protein ParE
MKVLMSENARAYVHREARYLSKHSPSAAKSFSERMKEARKNLRAFNEMGFESEELPIPGMRRLIVGDYLLDYEILESEIHIVAIRHGRQLPPTIGVEQDFDFEVDMYETPGPSKR